MRLASGYLSRINREQNIAFINLTECSSKHFLPVTSSQKLFSLFILNNHSAWLQLLKSYLQLNGSQVVANGCSFFLFKGIVGLDFCIGIEEEVGPDYLPGGSVIRFG